MKSYLLLILVALTSGMCFAQTKVLSTGRLSCNDDLSPHRTIVKVDDGYEVTYSFPVSNLLLRKDVDLFNISYPEFNSVYKEGILSIPVRSDSFSIPPGYDYSLVLEESNYVEKDFKYDLSIGDSTGDLIPLKQIFDQAKYPKNAVELSYIGKYRGVNIISAEIYPVQFSQSSNTVRLYTSLKYKVTLIKKYDKLSDASGQDSIQHKVFADDSFLTLTTINGYENGPKRIVGGNPNGDFNDMYLIITTADMSEPAMRFAKWKTIMGFDVKVTTKPQKWTEAELKTAIKSTYQSNPNLKYLLFIGDIKKIPAKIIPAIPNESSTTRHPTDLYYACMDGDDDVIPDLFRGRLPASNVTEANSMVNKIINYERNPVSDASFYNKASHVAVWNPLYGDYGEFGIMGDVDFYYTSENVISSLNYLSASSKHPTVERLYYTNKAFSPKYWSLTAYEAGNQIPEYLQKPTFMWDATSEKINNSINEGRLYVSLYAHGDEHSLGDIEYYDSKNNHFGTFTNCYHTEDNFTTISELSNGRKLPLILSSACSVGNFSSSNGCLAEAFMKNEFGGCIAIMSASGRGVGINLPGSILTHFWPAEALLDQEEHRLGHAIDAELNKNIFWGKDAFKNLYQRETVHLFGDPSMSFITQTPLPISPNYKVTGKPDDGTMLLSCYVYNVKDLKICFYDKKNKTKACFTHGTVYNYKGDMNDLVVCITGRDCRPCILGNYSPFEPVQYISASEEEEGIINEDIVWQYIDSVKGSPNNQEENPDMVWFDTFRFHGTTEKNGHVYHNLYHKYIGWPEMSISKEDIVSQTEFDFDEMSPSFYIRREGDKYYMLWGEGFKGFGASRYYYGSPEIESLIYDFSIPYRDSFEICTKKTAPYTFPEGYTWGLLWDKPPYELPDDNEVYRSDLISRYNTKSYCFGDDKLELIEYSGSCGFDLVSPKYGALLYYGLLPVPYAKTLYFGERKYTCGINNIYDLDGNVVLRGLDFVPGSGIVSEPHSVGISAVAEDDIKISYFNGVLRIENVEGRIAAEIFDITGRCVWRAQNEGNLEEQIGGLQHGVYILNVETLSGSVSRKFIF